MFGSTNLAAVGVPNVYVNNQPPSPLLNGVPTNIIAVVGVATWGPKNSPVIIGTLQDEVLTFGFPTLYQYDLGIQVYNSIQQGANNFRCVRVTDGTDTFASATFLDGNSDTGAVLYSKYTGSYPNDNCNAVLSAGSGSTISAPTYKLTIYFNGGVPEVFDNIGGTGAAFWNNLVSAVNQGQNNLRGPSQICTAAIGNEVSSVTVSAAGVYTALPTASTSGAGTGATFAVHMSGVSGAVAAIGTGYAPGNNITITGGTHSASAVLNVTNTRLATLAVNAGGAGYQVGDTIVLAGGTFTTAAVLTVASVDGSGTVLTVTITNRGVYTANTVSFTQGSTSGIGTGATFNTALYGVNAVTVGTPGNYTALPSNPVAQGSSTGSGTGATVTMSWGVLSVQVTAGGTGYLSTDTIAITGTGSGAIAALVLGSLADPVNATHALSGGTDGISGVTDQTLIGNDSATPRSGMYALRNTGAAVAIIADQTNPNYWDDQETFGMQENMYMQVAMAPGYQDDINAAIAVKQNSALNEYIVKLLMGDWCYINDPFNSVTRLTSPQGFMAGVLATIAPSNSSLNKIINGIVGTQKSQEKRRYSDADLLALQTNGIDVITNYIPVSPQAGVFGGRLGVNTSPSITTNGDNYPRMVDFLTLTFKSGLGQFIGLPQTPDLQNQARSVLVNFLQNLVQIGLIGTTNGSPAFRVILDATNNTPNRVALGFMQADIQVTLFSIVINFIVNLQAGQSVQVQVLPVQLAA